MFFMTIPEFVPSLYVNAPFVIFRSLEPIDVFPASFEYAAEYPLSDPVPAMHETVSLPLHPPGCSILHSM